MNIDQSIASASQQASAPPHSSVNAWSPRQSTWPSDVVPPTSAPYNSMEQFQDYGQTACSSDPVPIPPYMEADLFPDTQPFYSNMTPQEGVASDARSVVEQEVNLGLGNGERKKRNSCDERILSILRKNCSDDMESVSTPPQNRINSGWSQQCTWSNDLATPTFNTYNEMEQIQDYGQMADFGANSVSLVDAGLSSTMQLSNFMNPQMVAPRTAFAPLHNSFETEWPKQGHWPSNVTTPTFTHPMATRSTAPAFEIPFMMADQFSGMQSSGFNMSSQEVVASDERSVARVEQDGNLGPDNDERKLRRFFDERTRSILKKHYLENRRLTPAMTEHIANQTELTPKQVKQWFKNRQFQDRGVARNNKIMNSQEGIASDASCVTPVEQRNLGPGNGVRKIRQRLDKRAVSIFKKHFLKDPKPNLATQLELAHQTGSIRGKVGRWFRNHRRRNQAAAESKRHKNIIDAANWHGMESTPTEHSENINPMDFNRLIEPAHGHRSANFLGMMPIFDNPPSMPYEGFHLPMQQFSPQMAPNSTHEQTAAVLNPAQLKSPTFYYYPINDDEEW
uniref:Homeobox domain-containing protein n=1 Tax=Panagrellus redivivus TaxID=6233 RepID=A0A7E4VRR2_PANRE